MENSFLRDKGVKGKLEIFLSQFHFFFFLKVAYLKLLFSNLSDHHWRIRHCNSQRFFVVFFSEHSACLPLILGFWPCVLEANLCLCNCSNFFPAITFLFFFFLISPFVPFLFHLLPQEISLSGRLLLFFLAIFHRGTNSHDDQNVHLERGPHSGAEATHQTYLIILPFTLQIRDLFPSRYSRG